MIQFVFCLVSFEDVIWDPIWWFSFYFIFWVPWNQQLGLIKLYNLYVFNLYCEEGKERERGRYFPDKCDIYTLFQTCNASVYNLHSHFMHTMFLCNLFFLRGQIRCRSVQAVRFQNAFFKKFAQQLSDVHILYILFFTLNLSRFLLPFW